MESADAGFHRPAVSLTCADGMSATLIPIRRRVVPALVCAAIGLLGTAGCGGDSDSLPDNAVAQIGDKVITKAGYKRALRANLAAAALAEDRPVSYEPPKFTACVAAQRGQDDRGKMATDAELRKQCEERYDELQGETFRSLLLSEWVRQEARRLDIELTARALRRAVASKKREDFSSEAAFGRYLTAAGMSDRDYASRVRIRELEVKVYDELFAEAARISGKDVRSFYLQNKDQFLVRERRGVRTLATNTRADAERGRAALERGQSWKSVVQTYSDVPFLTQLRGTRLEFEHGQQEARVDRAIFQADAGEIVGPIKTEVGWQVFGVVGHPQAPYQQSLAQARDEIIDILRPERQRQAGADYLKRYRTKTTCAPGYEIPDCRNGPGGADSTGP
jgi:parvulin-like peptidyl-prolyl isomerase